MQRYLLRYRLFQMRRNSGGFFSGYSISLFINIQDWTDAMGLLLFQFIKLAHTWITLRLLHPITKLDL